MAAIRLRAAIRVQQPWRGDPGLGVCVHEQDKLMEHSGDAHHIGVQQQQVPSAAECAHSGVGIGRKASGPGVPVNPHLRKPVRDPSGRAIRACVVDENHLEADAIGKRVERFKTTLGQRPVIVIDHHDRKIERHHRGSRHSTNRPAKRCRSKRDRKQASALSFMCWRWRPLAASQRVSSEVAPSLSAGATNPASSA